MKTFEEQFTAWVDGTLSGEELAAFERELATRPDARADKAAALKLATLLRAHPAAPPLTNPDFFNLQLTQRIEAESAQSATRSAREKSSWFWSLPRLAWAGAACLLVAFALFKAWIPVGQPPPLAGAPYFAQVIETWPADDTISARTVYTPEDNVTVLWIEGLEKVPAHYAIQ